MYIQLTWQYRKADQLFSALVDMQFDAQHMKCQDGDLAKAEYKCFLSKVAVDREKFSNFNISKEGGDSFLGSYLNKIHAYKHAWMVMIFVFTLSHGQSEVERNFNISDDIMVENMHNNSFRWLLGLRKLNSSWKAEILQIRLILQVTR